MQLACNAENINVSRTYVGREGTYVKQVLPAKGKITQVFRQGKVISDQMHALAQNYEPHAASRHVIDIMQKNAQLVSRSSHNSSLLVPTHSVQGWCASMHANVHVNVEQICAQHGWMSKEILNLVEGFNLSFDN